LLRPLPPAAALVITAVVFGASHFEPLQFPALAVFGGLTGWLAYRNGRLGMSIFAHVGFNATTVVVLLLDRGHS
jgi:membrane protease YdiL (CAAX protease family)